MGEFDFRGLVAEEQRCQRGQSLEAAMKLNCTDFRPI